MAYVSNNLYSAVNILIVRRGIMQGASTYAVENASADSEALTSFLAQYYTRHQLPDELIVQDFCESALLGEYLRTAHGKSVSVSMPKQGHPPPASFHGGKERIGIPRKGDRQDTPQRGHDDQCCKRLQEILGLSRYPRRMECYDISNISGVDNVGSMVVFIDGEADRDSYRRFKIRTVEGADDFASLREVLARRPFQLGTEEEERFPKPDLVIIDGGKGAAFIRQSHIR